MSDASVLATIPILAADATVFMVGNRDAGTVIAGMNYHRTAVDNRIYTSYFQRDTCRSSSPLNIFKDTMGSSGYLTSCITAFLTTQGIHSFSPGELNQVLNENNVCNGQGSIVRRELEQALSHARIRLDCGMTSESIDRLLEEEMYPIVKARRKGGAVHWVILTNAKKDIHDITTMDPIDGLVHMSDYGDCIYGVRVMTGSVETLETNSVCLQA